MAKEIKCPNQKNEKVSREWCKQAQYSAWCRACKHCDGRKVSVYQSANAGKSMLE